ncbi:MAG: hypothetical protein U1F30_12010 [Steroidobacteraceae bacterium]
MHGPHRRLLLELHRALAAVAPEARAAAARACVAGWELPLDLELAAAPNRPRGSPSASCTSWRCVARPCARAWARWPPKPGRLRRCAWRWPPPR